MPKAENGIGFTESIIIIRRTRALIQANRRAPCAVRAAMHSSFLRLSFLSSGEDGDGDRNKRGLCARWGVRGTISLVRELTRGRPDLCIKLARLCIKGNRRHARVLRTPPCCPIRDGALKSRQLRRAKSRRAIVQRLNSRMNFHENVARQRNE